MSGRELNRRSFLKTTGAIAGAAGLAGCNSLNGDNSDGSETDTATDTDTSHDPTYDLRTSALEYDLTDIATEETNTHDQAYVQENYSTQLGITVLENGEQVSLEELTNVHLEDEEGEQVETTEEGYVPEYAVEDGQELTVTAEVNGETLQDTITVTKELPSEFYADARIQEDGEVLYNTDWSTPYSFDNHIVNRQAFLDKRAQRRDELTADEVMTETDIEKFQEGNQEYKSEASREEFIEYVLRGINAGIRGLGEFEGSNASPNSFNVEKALQEYTDFDPKYVGSFVNPRELDVEESTDGDGIRVNSQVAYVDGDWFHNGEEYVGASHISDIDEIEMAKDPGQTASKHWAVSVLAEMEEGEDSRNFEEFVKDAVTSPVTLNENITELDMSDSVAWDTLEQIRDNSEWDSTMAPIELATAIGSDSEGRVRLDGEALNNSRIRISGA